MGDGSSDDEEFPDALDYTFVGTPNVERASERRSTRTRNEGARRQQQSVSEEFQVIIADAKAAADMEAKVKLQQELLEKQASDMAELKDQIKRLTEGAAANAAVRLLFERFSRFILERLDERITLCINAA